MTPGQQEPEPNADAALASMGASLMPRALSWLLVGSSPAEAEKVAGIPAHTAVYGANVTDGALRCLAYEKPNGWVMEVAHVAGGVLGPDGNPRAGRIPHLWELRAARERFIPDRAIMGLAFLPPTMATRPANCILLAQMGEVKPAAGLFTPQ